jgi:hypothetical protein
MEVDMTSPYKSAALLFLAGSALWTASPAFALGPTERAVTDCRAQALGQFGPGEVRSHRVGAIAGNSRSTRVTVYVTADRRYTVQCASDGQGRIVTASFSPARPDGPQLAAGQR